VFVSFGPHACRLDERWISDSIDLTLIEALPFHNARDAGLEVFASGDAASVEESSPRNFAFDGLRDLLDTV